MIERNGPWSRVRRCYLGCLEWRSRVSSAATMAHGWFMWSPPRSTPACVLGVGRCRPRASRPWRPGRGTSRTARMRCCWCGTRIVGAAAPMNVHSRRSRSRWRRSRPGGGQRPGCGPRWRTRWPTTVASPRSLPHTGWAGRPRRRAWTSTPRWCSASRSRPRCSASTRPVAASRAGASTRSHSGGYGWIGGTGSSTCTAIRACSGRPRVAPRSA